MYKSFLRHNLTSEYLVMLLKHNLLEYNNKTGKYTTTYKGFKFIEINEELQNLLNGN